MRRIDFRAVPPGREFVVVFVQRARHRGHGPFQDDRLTPDLPDQARGFGTDAGPVTIEQPILKRVEFVGQAR